MYSHQGSHNPYQQPYGNSYPTPGYPPAAPGYPPPAPGYPPQNPNPQPWPPTFGQYASQPQYSQQHNQPQTNGQPPYQHNGPPPKRQKNNPVITRYAPPPGYVQPPNPQTACYPPPVPPPGYGVPPVPGPHGFQPPYQPPQPYQPPNQAAPPFGYPPRPPFPPQHGYPSNQAYQQPPYQPPQQPPKPFPAPQPQHPPRASSVSHAQYPSQAPTPTNTAAPVFGPPKPPPISHDRSASVAKSTTDQSTAPTEDGSVDYGFDLDFESEAPFGKDPDSIVPELSLGIIVWHPAVPVKTPLPSTFAEAELEALAPAKPRTGEDESVSQYFVKEKLHEVDLSIRQSEEWESVKGDLIHVEFESRCETVPLAQIIANRNRPDSTAKEPEMPDPSKPIESQEVEVVMQEAEASPPGEEEEDQADGDQAMDVSSDEEEEAPSPPKPDAVSSRPSSLLDNLEQALSSSDAMSKAPQLPFPRDSMGRAPMSRSRSPERVPPAPRDAAQESILASLGVEGSPKTMFHTPGPATSDSLLDRGPNGLSGPLPRSNSSGGIPQGLQSHIPGIMYNGRFAPNAMPVPPPPPPERQRSPSYDPWKAHESNGHGGDSPKSQASQHTMVGSDFHPDDTDQEQTPKPKPTLERSESSRKRAYEHVAEPEEDGRRRQHDDTTPRMRRTRPKVAAAYSRRW